MNPTRRVDRTWTFILTAVLLACPWPCGTRLAAAQTEAPPEAPPVTPATKPAADTPRGAASADPTSATAAAQDETPEAFGRRRRTKPAPPTDPPPGPVRCVGEWEESQGVMMLWRNADLVKKLRASGQVVYIPVSDTDSRREWRAWLKDNDISDEGIEFIEIAVRRIYTRDFGPFFVWDGNGELAIVDYHYGRDEASEAFNKSFAKLFSIPYYNSGIRHVGGNYLPNGYRTSFSSTHVFEQNPDVEPAKILEVMERYFGVERYWTIAPKTIWHHDTWGKPCSPDTLIVVDFPDSDVYHHVAANESARFYETLESPWGRPYRILRLPMFEKERPRWREPRSPSVFDTPGLGFGFGGGFGSAAFSSAAEGGGRNGGTEESEEKREDPTALPPPDPAWEADLEWNEDRGPYYRPYMNSLISNGAVFVPVDGCEDDEVALDVFRKAFPGYDVVGVDSGGTYSFDSLHCRTRNFVRRDAIRVYPYPPGDTEDTENGYPVLAEVIPPKGSALAAGYPRVRFAESGEGPFEVLVMEPVDGQDHMYRATLPARPHGTEISFYVEARDDGGRSALYPPVAPRGLMSFEVRRDRRPPEVSRFQPARVASAADGPPMVRLLAKDDMGAPEVRVELEVNGVRQDDVPLEREDGTYWYSGPLPVAAAPGDVLSYRVVARDASKAKNEAALPLYGRVYCTVEEAAPVGVVDMTKRSGAGAFITQALEDLEVASVLYREWPRDFTAHPVWFVCLGVFGDNHVLTEQEASDLAAALESGRSVYLEGGDTWCHDPQAGKLCPLFGVKPLERGRGFERVEGEPRTFASGMTFEYVGENLFTDRIDAVAPARLLFSSHRYNRGRAVMRRTEKYRSIASTFVLAGLLDGKWPCNRKEILVRCYEFLADTRVTLRTAGSAKPGDVVAVRVQGKPGDRYVVLASRAEYHARMPGYEGALRLDPAHLYHLGEGRIPRDGVARVRLEVPDDVRSENLEIHCQALIGEALEPGRARYTNRDVLRIAAAAAPARPRP